MRPICSLVGAALLSGCAAPLATCMLPEQKPMLMIDLYFGRDITGRAKLSDAEWADFTRAQITPRFPAGFTVIDAQGQWLNPATHTIGAEASKMVRIAAASTPDTGLRVRAIVEAYRAQFHQLAVGVSSGPVCAAF